MGCLQGRVLAAVDVRLAIGNAPNGTKSLKVKVQNDSSGKIYVAYKVAGAPYEANQLAGGVTQDYDMGATPANALVTKVAGTANSMTPNGYATGLAAGAYTEMVFRCYPNYTSGFASASTSATLTFPFFIRKDGETTWTEYSFTYSDTFNWMSGGAGPYGFQFASDLVGTYSYTGPPPVPAGKITASGGVTGENGAGRVEIMLGYPNGQVVAMQEVTGAAMGTAIPPAVYDSAVAAADDLKRWVVFFNGKWVAAGIIELDIYGAFDINVDLAAIQMEGNVPELELTPDGEHELPVNDPDELPGPGGEDPSHNRPDPGPVNDLGPDPKEDDNEAVSVKDHYRATRAAIEDALATPSNVERFNFDNWSKIGDAAKNASAASAGDAIGEGIDALADISGEVSIPLPGSGTTEGIGIRYLRPSYIGGGTVTGVMMPPSWSGYVRTFFLGILTILFLIAMLITIRSGFAGK